MNREGFEMLVDSIAILTNQRLDCRRTKQFHNIFLLRSFETRHETDELDGIFRNHLCERVSRRLDFIDGWPPFATSLRQKVDIFHEFSTAVRVQFCFAS